MNTWHDDYSREEDNVDDNGGGKDDGRQRQRRHKEKGNIIHFFACPFSFGNSMLMKSSMKYGYSFAVEFWLNYIPGVSYVPILEALKYDDT